MLDAATDLKVAQKIADDITAQVQKTQAQTLGAGAGVSQPLQSGVLVTHSHIICGFFPYPTPFFNIDV